MKYVSSFVISWLWPEVVRSWRRDVLWIRRHHLRQLRRRRVGRKTEFWWKSGERHGKAANLHEVIDFYQRGCLRLWCFQSSVLEVAKKYIVAESGFCGSGNTAFSQKKFDLPAAGKSRWIDVKEANSSQRLGKTSRFFFRCLQKQIGVFKWQRETFFISFSSRCVEVVHRRLWSGILNPPDDFSQLSFLKTLL